MDISEAKELLELCHKDELRNHYFDDREIEWYFNKINVASGYLGSTGQSVTIYEYREDGEIIKLASFYADQARDLSRCFKTREIGRNDVAGDDQYRGL